MPSPIKPYRKLTKTGMGSYYLTLPRDMIKALGWKERQKLTVKKDGQKLIIEDWK